MARADDRGVIGIAGQAGILLRHLRLDRGEEVRNPATRHQGIIGCDAGLAGIEQLAPDKARHGLVEIDGQVEDGG